MTIAAAGDKAPQFTAADDSDKRVSLADLKGSWVVLFFYPVKAS
jgi:peroxiredoxin